MHPVPDSEVKRLSLDAVLRNEVDAVAETAYYLWECGWAEGSAGNISVDVSALLAKKPIHPEEYRKATFSGCQPVCGDRYLFVTAQGARFRELAHRPDENLLLIYIASSCKEYHVLWGDPESRVTSEIDTHLALHAALLRQAQPLRAVVHVHPTHLMALTQIPQYATPEALNRLLMSMHPEMKMLAPNGIGFVRYTRPGTRALADATVKAFTGQSLFVWEKHGCVAVGSDVHEAFDIIACADRAAEIFFICRSAGYEPEGLTPEQLRELDAGHPPTDVG